MSYARIYMGWVNNTPSSLTFVSTGEPEHGTNPGASPTTMSAVGTAGNTSTVTASSNSNITGPGPQGTYQWQIVGSNPTQFFDASYNHPFGSGTTWVTVSCPAGYVASGCGQGPAQTINLNSNCASLQNHEDATCTITVALAGS